MNEMEELLKGAPARLMSENSIYVSWDRGSQCVGMGADFYEACPKARAVYDMASELIGN